MRIEILEDKKVFREEYNRIDRELDNLETPLYPKNMPSKLKLRYLFQKSKDYNEDIAPIGEALKEKRAYLKKAKKRAKGLQPEIRRLSRNVKNFHVKTPSLETLANEEIPFKLMGKSRRILNNYSGPIDGQYLLFKLIKFVKNR